MSVQLHDTYSRSRRAFEPLRPPHVGLYCCGPTVYDYAHIGNLRTYLFEDLLRRALELHGYTVRHVVNITDVGHLTSDADTGEDRMEKGARREGKSAWEIAEYYTREFQRDFERLNILEPTIWCRATDHIDEQIAFIRCIERNGFAYRTADGIYFDTSRLPDYGHLARVDVEGLRAGARVEMADKRNPTDFALWKFSTTDRTRQMEWESPWGVGFPGWHIECSAMAAKYLGTYFDIHCGGEDHPPVHHTNEIAQTQACHGTRLANFWLHGAFLQVDQARMAKSAGGFVRVQTLIDRGYDPLAYRFLCLQAHYRTRLVFTWRSLDGAATALERLRAAAHDGGPGGEVDEGYVTRFTDIVGDDLNTPRAVALTWELVRSDLDAAAKTATLLHFERVLGLGLTAGVATEPAIPDAILALVRVRERARGAGRWAEADAIRDQVLASGFAIDDTAEGPRVRARRARPPSPL